MPESGFLPWSSLRRVDARGKGNSGANMTIRGISISLFRHSCAERACHCSDDRLVYVGCESTEPPGELVEWGSSNKKARHRFWFRVGLCG